MNKLISLTDEALMVLYQEGDEKAFEVLYQRHSRRVYGFLKKRIQDPHMADDVFQATFTKLHTSKQRYQPKYPFLPWLFTVCRSEMIDQFRKVAKNQEDPTADLGETVANPVIQSSQSKMPDLSRLPANQRAALTLRYQDDLEFAEIAKRLSTSAANVRQLISRAIKSLKAGEKGG